MYDVVRNILDVEASISKVQRFRLNALGERLTPILIKKPLQGGILGRPLRVLRHGAHTSTRCQRGEVESIESLNSSKPAEGKTPSSNARLSNFIQV